MIKFKLLYSRYYCNIDDCTKRNTKESGEYYINQDIERFYNQNPDIKILDINLIPDKYGGIIVAIKYKEQ